MDPKTLGQPIKTVGQPNTTVTRVLTYMHMIANNMTKMYDVQEQLTKYLKHSDFLQACPLPPPCATECDCRPVMNSALLELLIVKIKQTNTMLASQTELAKRILGDKYVDCKRKPCALKCDCQQMGGSWAKRCDRVRSTRRR
jgi:hypothetical protein